MLHQWDPACSLDKGPMGKQEITNSETKKDSEVSPGNDLIIRNDESVATKESQFSFSNENTININTTVPHEEGGKAKDVEVHDELKDDDNNDDDDNDVL